MAARSWRISAFVGAELGARLYVLADRSACSVTALVEEAIREYLAARPEGTALSLSARLPRRAGRPSKLDAVLADEHELRLRKRTGRPMTKLPRDGAPG